MLYQVATGLLSADEIAPPLRVVFSRQKNVDVVLSEVTGVDTVNRRVLLPACDLPYDYLILATGIHVNYFGHDEWKAIAPGLDGLDDADQIRTRILRAFEEAERHALCADADHAQIQEMLTFVLVGAGTVGVELPPPSPKWPGWRWLTIFVIWIRGRRRFCSSTAHLASCQRLPRISRRRHSVICNS